MQVFFSTDASVVMDTILVVNYRTIAVDNGWSPMVLEIREEP